MAGCVTEQPANQQLVQKLGEQCQSYGFKPGSDAFAACIFQLDQNRIAKNRQTRMAVAEALSEAGEDMQRNAASNRPVSCNSIRVGNSVNTTCY